MGFGLRVFFFDDNNRLKRISLKRFDRLMRPQPAEAPMTEHLGQRVRCAEVIVEFENRRPVAITGVFYSIVKFDEAGRVDAGDLRAQRQLAVESLGYRRRKRSEGSVIYAEDHFIAKRVRDQHSWQPSIEVIEAIERAIFGDDG